MVVGVTGVSQTIEIVVFHFVYVIFPAFQRLVVISALFSVDR